MEASVTNTQTVLRPQNCDRDRNTFSADSDIIKTFSYYLFYFTGVIREKLSSFFSTLGSYPFVGAIRAFVLSLFNSRKSLHNNE
jgi:hypothetical protein